MNKNELVQLNKSIEEIDPDNIRKYYLSKDKVESIVEELFSEEIQVRKIYTIDDDTGRYVGEVVNGTPEGRGIYYWNGGGR